MFCPHCSALLPNPLTDRIECLFCKYSCTYYDLPKEVLNFETSSENHPDPEWFVLYKAQIKTKVESENINDKKKSKTKTKKNNDIDNESSIPQTSSQNERSSKKTSREDNDKEGTKLNNNQKKKRQRTSSESSGSSNISKSSSSSSSSSDSSSSDESGLKSNKNQSRAVVEETCPSCGHPRATFYTVQLRSVDEGQTVFCK